MGDPYFRNVQDAVENYGIKALDPFGTIQPLRMDSQRGLLTSGPLFDTGLIQINTGNGLYTTADAFGGKFTIAVPPVGTISQVFFYDLDDEGISLDVVLFDADFTATADDSAYAVTDVDHMHCIGVVSITSFTDLGGMQLGQAFPLISYSVPSGVIYAQCIIRGAPTVAAGSEPYLRFFVQ